MVSRNENLTHLVILGAGATMAAFPHGDENGVIIPCMNEFLAKTGIINYFSDYRDEIQEHDNLEDLYSFWFYHPARKEACRALEFRIRQYMESLEAGRKVNIYTKLLLSLTNRDYVATFNWDPLMPQTYGYLSNYTHDLPHVLFLHGNVAMGICENCREVGYLSMPCNKCGASFKPMELLYPVKDKNYEKSEYIRDTWRVLMEVMENADFLTIFGYSAPKSDTAAISMMQEAYDSSVNRQLKQIQLIDIGDEDYLRNNYSPFIYKESRFSICWSFYDSWLAHYPRRSCEVLFKDTMECFPENVCDVYGNRIMFEPADDWPELIDKLHRIEFNP